MIKMYGWEIAFKEIIQSIREKEIESFIKYKLIKSFLMITKDYSVYLCGFGYFLIVYNTE